MAQIFKPKKKSAEHNKHYSLEVTRLDHQGAGIGYQNKKPIFVEGALPNETVVVQNIENKAKFAKAKLIKVLKPSTDRIEAFCPKYSECGGCNLQHLSHEKQVETKQNALQQLMEKFAHQSLPQVAPILGEERQYRRRARISIQLDKNTHQLQFGFRAKQSKQIVDIDSCPVLVEPINALLPSLKELLVSFQKPRELGHVELVSVDSGVHITLRTTANINDEEREKLTSFMQQNACHIELHQGELTPECLSNEAPSYNEVGLPLSFATTDFIQVNAQVNQKMVSQAIEWLDIEPEHQVLDLFCGMGNFTLPIAKQAKHVIGVEGVAEMVERATLNAKSNQVKNAEFYQANLADEELDAQWQKTKFDRILLDPARAGASGIIDKLAEFNAAKIVYVSCNAATLARDSQKLQQAGYQLEKLGMLDMFPQTGHLESMALFTLPRNGKGKTKSQQSKPKKAVRKIRF